MRYFKLKLCTLYALAFVFVLLISHTASIKLYGDQQNNTKIQLTSNSSKSISHSLLGSTEATINVLNNSKAQGDNKRPVVNITYPAYSQTVTTGKITIQGIASDSGSGLHNLTAAAHTFPFDGHFRVKLTSQPIPVSSKNWSRWSLPLTFNKAGTYRVVITAIDNAGNRNYADITISVPITVHYLYGCTNYEYLSFHCDPISNDFESHVILANYTKVASATREPDYVTARFNKGISTTGAHALESLRANIIHSYDASQFSVFLSYMPNKYDKGLGNPYETLMSYKNGIFKGDLDNAGWELELVPNNSTTMKTLQFTVFNTKGNATSTKEVGVPVGVFSDITGTFDGKMVRLYVNGTLRSESPFSGVYNGHVEQSNFLKIGGDAYCSCYLASGIFDEVRYYNYSMGETKIKLVNNHSQTNPDSPEFTGNGLVGYWKFDGNLKDYSDFKNDMFYNTMISSMAFAPDGRLFFNEKNSGNIRVMVNNTILERPFVSIPNIHVDFEQGLLGLALDSKFKQNHFIYVYYNYGDNNTTSVYYKDNSTGKVHNIGTVWAKIVRFTDVGNRGTNETVILDRIPASAFGFHTGGALMFNKIDDKLYATVGDAIERRKAPQNLSSLNGKTLRINRDGSIPNDNPFPNSPVYTYGHRNMYGIAFDERGHGIVTEPGAALYDEINSQIKGENYGWYKYQRDNIPPDPLANDSTIKPMRSYYVAQNPTQAIYYNGDKYPELKGKFVVGTFRGNIFAYKTNDDGKKLLQEIEMKTAFYPSMEVVGTAVSPSGDIYFGAYDIFRLGKLDLNSSVQKMFPVDINATNVRLSDVSYSDQTKNLTIGLTDSQPISTLSIKVPKAIEITPQGYQCQTKSNFSGANPGVGNETSGNEKNTTTAVITCVNPLKKSKSMIS